MITFLTVACQKASLRIILRFSVGRMGCLPDSQPWPVYLCKGGCSVGQSWSTLDVSSLLHSLKDSYRVYLGKHALGYAEAREQMREVVCSIPHP